jgi:polyadenylate-binding protein
MLLSFRTIKTFGLKQAPKLTIALLDGDDLRALAHLMNSYPSVLKEKAVLVQASLSK